MKIVDVEAFPTSFPLPPGGPRLGIGQAVKRDAVMVKITTEDGIIGWGESHHGRAHTAIATLIRTTLRQPDHLPFHDQIRTFQREWQALRHATTGVKVRPAESEHQCRDPAPARPWRDSTCRRPGCGRAGRHRASGPRGGS